LQHGSSYREGARRGNAASRAPAAGTARHYQGSPRATSDFHIPLVFMRAPSFRIPLAAPESEGSRPAAVIAIEVIEAVVKGSEQALIEVIPPQTDTFAYCNSGNVIALKGAPSNDAHIIMNNNFLKHIVQKSVPCQHAGERYEKEPPV